MYNLLSHIVSVACSKATLKAHGVTIAFEGADAEVPDYLRPDTNAVFNITCPVSTTTRFQLKHI